MWDRPHRGKTQEGPPQDADRCGRSRTQPALGPPAPSKNLISQATGPLSQPIGIRCSGRNAGTFPASAWSRIGCS